MRKLLASFVFVCALASFASAGDPNQPGAEPTPTPPPCLPGVDCPGDGGTSSASSTVPPFIVIWVNGVPVIVYTY